MKLRADLRAAVHQAFEARQELQRAELAEFSRRLQRMGQSIDARNRIADKIIDRRVEELLDPKVNWEATESAHEATSSEKAVISTDPAVPENIDDKAWGEPARGLRMAVVGLSDNAPSDKSFDILCVLENVSNERIVLDDDGWSLSTECDIRTTSRAQVRTLPGGQKSDFQPGSREKILEPGQRIVAAKKQIRITDDPEETVVPDSADLLIIDKESSRFRNAIYILRCNVRAKLKGEELPAIPLASGQIAIAFNYPADVQSEATSRLLHSATIAIGFNYPADGQETPVETIVFKRLGAKFRGADSEDVRNGTTSAHRLQIVELQPDGPAASAGLRPDDVIVAINEIPVSTLDDINHVCQARTFGMPLTIKFVRDHTDSWSRVKRSRTLPEPGAVQGVVRSRTDSEVEVSLGVRDGIQPGDILSIWSQQDIENIVEVTVAQQDRCVARIVKESTDTRIGVDDRVTPQTPAPAIPVSLTCDREFRLHWAGGMSRSPTTATFTIPASLPSEFKLSEIAGADDLEIYVTVEPRRTSPDGLQFLMHEGIALEINDADIGQLQAGKDISKALYITSGNRTARSIASFAHADMDPVEIAMGQGTVIAVVRMSSQSEPKTPVSGSAEPAASLQAVAQNFETPEALLDYMTDCGVKEDFAAYMQLLTDDEAKRYAGLMLQSAQTFMTVSGMAAAASGEITEQNPGLAAVAGIHNLLQSSMRNDASPEAEAAFQQLMIRATQALLTNGSEVPPVMNPNDYSQLLKTAAGVLKDDRIFAAEISKAFSALNLRASASKPVPNKPQWSIVIDGDAAVATDTRKADEPSGDAMPSGPIELQRIDGYWKISKLFSDDAIREVAAGPTVSRSTPAE